VWFDDLDDSDDFDFDFEGPMLELLSDLCENSNSRHKTTQTPKQHVSTDSVVHASGEFLLDHRLAKLRLVLIARYSKFTGCTADIRRDINMGSRGLLNLFDRGASFTDDATHVLLQW